MIRHDRERTRAEKGVRDIPRRESGSFTVLYLAIPQSDLHSFTHPTRVLIRRRYPGLREIGLFTTNMLYKYEGIALALARTRVK